MADWKLFKEQTDSWFVAIGNNAVRATAFRLLEDAGLTLATVMHPRAMVSPRATLGNGSTIMAGAVVGAEAILGLGAVMAGGSVLGKKAWMQANSALGYGVVIEQDRVLVPGEIAR